MLWANGRIDSPWTALIIGTRMYHNVVAEDMCFEFNVMFTNGIKIIFDTITFYSSATMTIFQLDE